MQSVFLRPIKFDTTPKMQLPRIAPMDSKQNFEIFFLNYVHCLLHCLMTSSPMEKHEPIHDVSDNVIGPLCNGESFDCSFGKFGDSHPMAIPWHKLIIFAEKSTKSEKVRNTLNKLNTICLILCNSINGIVNI